MLPEMPKIKKNMNLTKDLIKYLYNFSKGPSITN